MSGGNYEIGFQALCRDEEYLVDSFSEWLNKHYAKDETRQIAMRQFGFIRNLSRNRKPLRTLISTAQVKACARLGMLNPKLRSVPGVEAPVLKSNLPKVLGITMYSSDQLLRRTGFDLRKGSGHLVEIPNELVEELRGEVARSMSMSEAAVLLGCTEVDADLVSIKLAKAGWAGCIQLRREHGIVRHFIQAELEKLLEIMGSLPMDAKKAETVGLSGRVIKDVVSETRLMADVLLGRESAYSDPAVPGLRGLRFMKRRYGGKPAEIGRKRIDAEAMIWSEFSAMTGVPSRGIQRLVEQGVVEPHSEKGLIRRSANDFHARYINPVRYLRGQGMIQQGAIKLLESFRFEYAFPHHDVGVVLVTRKHFIERVGPLYQPPKWVIDLWPDLVKAGNGNCPSLMIPRTPGDGMFDIGPSSRLLSIKTVFRDDGIWIGMEFLPQYRRLWKILTANEHRIQGALEYFQFEQTENLVTITATVQAVEDIHQATMDLGRVNEFFRNKRH